MGNKTTNACVLAAALALLMLGASFVPLAASRQADSGMQASAIVDSYVIYPAGQMAAKTGDKVVVVVKASAGYFGGSGTCDASSIGDTASSGVFDDGDYVNHRDRHANDGLYCNEFTVNAADAWYSVPFSLSAGAGSLIVAVDNGIPAVSTQHAVYPAGQSAVKEGDSVRIVGAASDYLVGLPQDYPNGIMKVSYNGTAIGGVVTEPMYDDGLHGDGMSADGVYGTDLIVVRNKTTALHTADITVTDIAGNTATGATALQIDNMPATITSIIVNYGAGGQPTQDDSIIFFSAEVSDPGAVGGIQNLGVTGDATAIGGDAKVAMNDLGAGNDATAGDGVYTSDNVIVKTGKATGLFKLGVTALDIAHNSFTQYGAVEVNNAKADITLLRPYTGEFVQGVYQFTASVSNNAAVTKVVLQISGQTAANMAYSGAGTVYTYPLNTSALTDGNYTATVTMHDVFQKTASTPAISFRIDNGVPAIGFVAPNKPGDIVGGAYTIKVSARDKPFLSAVSCKIDGKPWAQMSGGAYYTISWDTTKELDGNHTIAVEAVDGIGHAAQMALPVLVDNNAPVLSALDMPPADPSPYPVAGAVTVTVGATDAVQLQTVSITLGVGAPMEMFTNGTPGIYSYTIQTADFPTDDPLTVLINATDAAGHSSTMTRTLLVDNAAPAIADSAKLSEGTKSGIVEFHIAVSDPGAGVASAMISIDGGKYVNMTKSLAGDWAYTWSTGPFDNGRHVVTVKATDNVGNEKSAKFSFVVQNQDLVTPVVFMLVALVFFVMLYVVYQKKKRSAPGPQAPQGFVMPPQAAPPPQQMQPMQAPPPRMPMPPPPPPQGQQPGQMPPPPPPPQKKGLFGR